MRFENGVIFEGNQTDSKESANAYLFENGVIFEGNQTDLVAVQQAGGWKNLNMVSHYAQKKAVSNSGVKLS